MMASFATVSAAFPDADAISYNEAVDVLSALGVIGGYADGTFRPTNLVTRGAFAKMVSYVMNSGKDAAASYASSAVLAFSDVSATGATTPSIGYVVTKGYVDGYADGTFRPSNNVTGVAAAKQLLNALGIEGEYTGTGWANRVLGAGEDAGLFVGMDNVDLTANLTREQAAQMILNAITYSPTGFTYKVGGVEFDNLYDAMVFGKLAVTNFSGKIGNEATEINKVAAGDSLISTKFGIIPAFDTDAMGRPGTRYTNGTTVNVFSAYAPIATYTGPVTEATLFAAMYPAPLLNKTEATYTAIEDGNTVGTATVNRYGAQANWNAPFTGNGISTELYKVDTDAYVLVSVREYLGTVSVKEATLTEERAISVKLEQCSSGYESIDVTADLKTNEFKKDDMVIVTVACMGAEKPVIQSIELAKTVSGTVSKITSDGVYTINGAEYVKSQNYNGDIAITGIPGEWYVDSYGNLIGDKSAAPTVDVWNYGYLTRYDAQQYNAGTSNLIETTDAKVAAEKFEIVTSEGKKVVFDGAFTDADENDLVEFVWGGSENKAGFSAQLVRYTLKDGKVNKIQTVVTGDEGNGATTTTAIAKNNALVNGQYATANTLYFYVVPQAGTTPAKVAVATGYTNALAADSTTIRMFYNYDANGNVTDIAAIYVPVTELPTAPKTETTRVWFASLACEQTYDAVNKTMVVTYTDVYLDGVKGSLTFDADNATVLAQINNYGANTLYTYTVNAKTGFASLGGGNEGQLAANSTKTATVKMIETGYYVTDHSSVQLIYVGKDTEYYQVDALTGAVTKVAGLPTLSPDYSIEQISVDYNSAAALSATNPATVVYFAVVAN